ncbi:MAG: hypothetical protein JWP87_1150 [Labilithrix sp.]|nr:hypothetical protein [Labilithrix sp.]
MRLRLLAALFGAALVSTAIACEHGEALDASKMPENVRADYEVFAHKCSKCHSLARPLTANITDDEQWVLYVNRMRRQPGSGISPQDQEAILRFLRYYAADLRRIQAEKNGGAPVPAHQNQSVPVLTPATPAPPAPAPPASAVDGGAT